MAWEAVTAAQVSAIAGIRVENLEDWWYDAAADLIAEKANRFNVANTAAVVDSLDGTGTSRIRVRKPDISSITSVSIDDVLVESARYEKDGSFVVLVDTVGTNPYADSEVFPRGVKNVSISYVSGAATDPAVSLAIALIVKEMANLASSEGAESRLQFSGVDRSSAQAFRYGRSGPGVTSRIDRIIIELLGGTLRVA